MNETTAILFELRALADQIDQLECQARQNGAAASDAKLAALRGKAETLRGSMESTKRRHANRNYAVRVSAGSSSGTTNYSRGSESSSRASAIVARLGVQADRLVDALHAIGPSTV